MQYVSPDILVFMLLFVPVLLTATLGMVTYFYIKALKKLNEYKMSEQANIQKAQLEYEEIIKRASKKADEIILSSVSLDEKIKKSVQESYEKALQKELGKLNEKNINILNSVSKDIVSMLKQRADEDYSKVKQELEEYKKERLKEIDENIYELLLSVSKETIGKTLSLEDHQELIIKALEDAKKEKVL